MFVSHHASIIHVTKSNWVVFEVSTIKAGRQLLRTLWLSFKWRKTSEKGMLIEEWHNWQFLSGDDKCKTWNKSYSQVEEQIN